MREGFFRVVENNIFIGRLAPGKHVCYKNNHDVIRRNIYVNTSNGIIFEGIKCRTEELDQIDNNLYWSINGESQVSLTGTEGTISFEQWQQKGLDSNSIFADPMFTDPQRNDYTLSSDSPALSVGFEPFNMTTAGVLKQSFARVVAENYERHDFYVQSSATRPGRCNDIRDLNGLKIKNLVGMQEMSAAAVGQETGVLVVECGDDGLWTKIGLKPQDLILKWNGIDVDTVGELFSNIRQDAGKEITLDVDGNKPPRQVIFTCPV